MIKHYNCEANIVHHCNNRCASCNHLSPFAPIYYMPPETLRRDLMLASKLMHIELFNLQGGEPLLHPQLLECMDALSDSGIADDPGLLTNGKMLPYLPDEFWAKAHDRKLRITVTIYPNLPPGAIDVARAKASRFGVNLRDGPYPLPHFLKMLHANNGESYAGCPWKECWTLHEGYFFKCPIAPFMAPQFCGLPMETDGLKLTEQTTEQDILDYYHSNSPMQSCKMCAGTKYGGVPLKQCASLEEWIKESTV